MIGPVRTCSAVLRSSAIRSSVLLPSAINSESSADGMAAAAASPRPLECAVPAGLSRTWAV